MAPVDMWIWFHRLPAEEVQIPRLRFGVILGRIELGQRCPSPDMIFISGLEVPYLSPTQRQAVMMNLDSP